LANDKPKVSLALCGDYNRHAVEKAVRASVEALGGIEKFVRKGQRVLLKPNLLAPKDVSSMVTTHPEIMRAVLSLVLDAGADVVIGDSPAIGSAVSVSRKAGILEVAEHFGVKVMNFTEACRAKSAENCTYKMLDLAREALEAEVIINLPKIKTHGAMSLTMAVKNLFGCVVGRAKTQWHLKAGRDAIAFARMLVDICSTLKPALTIADAVVGMEGNGPSSGTLRRFGWVSASADVVAMDRVITDVLGAPPSRVYVLEAARQANAGETELDCIEVVGETIEAAKAVGQTDRRPVELPPDPFERSRMGELMRRLVKSSLTPEPVIDHNICTRCGTCIDICPPQVIKFEQMRKKDKAGYDRKAVIDRLGCIHCFCCQEVCPEGAITIKSGRLAGLLARSPAQA